MDDRARLWLANGRVLLAGESHSRAPVSLLIEGNRIAAVETGGPPRGARTIDLGGAVVLPGLVDAHLHLCSLGAMASQIDLVGAESEAAAANRIAAHMEGLAPDAFVLGRGWDQNLWPAQTYPRKETLDAVAQDRPVILTRIDGHALWVSSRALALAGISRGRVQPDGGEIRRDAHGEPTGVLIDNAMQAVLAVMPKPAPALLRGQLLFALQRCRAQGLTGVHDMGTTPEMLVALTELAASGELPARVTCYLSASEQEAETILSEPRHPQARLSVAGVKLLLDGALGSHGAALLEPYTDAPGTRGLLLHEPDALAVCARAAVAGHYQLALHAIGDRANRLALDVIAQAQHPEAMPHRIEHAQVVAPSDCPRFGALRVVASVQPLHERDDRPWVGLRLGQERLASAYPWQSLVAGGAVLALGSDAPIASENPWLGIEAAVTRSAVEVEATSRVSGADQRLSLRAAIDGYTTGAATACRARDRGKIAPGFLADVTIVETDPFALAPESLGSMKTVGTVVGGEPSPSLLDRCLGR